MIAAFSTSSPMASVALIREDGTVLFHAQAESKHQTSGSCLAMLQQGLEAIHEPVSSITLFAADVGPGSFIGTRVGIVLAKTLAYANGVMCLQMDSFDLISADQLVVFPSKRGEYFVRNVGLVPVRTEELPQAQFVGYGLPEGHPSLYPEACRFAPALPRLQPVAPEVLNAIPLIEPSISIPKIPYREVAGGN